VIPAVAFGMMAAAGSAAAQDTSHVALDTARIGRILGVFDDRTGQPIADVEITDLLAERTFRTQEAGLIGLAGFRRQHDSAAVHVRKVGYADTAFVVLLAAADTVPVQIFLRHVSVLEAMVAHATELPLSGNMRDFDSRRSNPTYGAHFVTPAEIPPDDPRTIGDVLFTIGYPRSTLRCPADRVRLYVDGRAKSYVTRAGATGIDLDLSEPASHYEAIEYYPGGFAPPEFTACSLVLWTRGS
jgi:hypothetical protein